MAFSVSARAAFILWLLILSFLGTTLAENLKGYVTIKQDGVDVSVPDNRRPSLYTGNFGDCMGDSSFNVTRFDAAYYRDNMTIVFHLAGESALKNESIMSMVSWWDLKYKLMSKQCTLVSMHTARAGST